MNFLNLGCGQRFHPDWTNIDFSSTNEGVIAHNLNQGIPFPDNFFDVVYHSHVLEHFSKAEAELFLKECYRVLRPKGIIRVVVPDLENIAKTYLTALEKIDSGYYEWIANYEWILLEMLDQTVRKLSGGDMKKYLLKERIDNQEFVINRMGIEAKKIIELGIKYRQKPHSISLPKNKLKELLKHLYQLFRYPKYCREVLIKKLLGDEYENLEIGRFRQNGEVHQWMYDRYSLSVILEKCGFEQIVKRTATESYLSNFVSYNLDTAVNGTVYRPHSLFMEGVKST